MRISDWSSDVCSSDLNAIKATGVAESTANLVATAGTITDSLAITVGPAEIQQLLGVRPAKAYVGVGRQQEFTAYGVYSTGETRDIADGKVTWSSRSEEHTSELQSLMRISYAVFCLKKKKNNKNSKK